MNQILQINGLSAGVEGKEILHNVSMCINKGETHVLMGPNGAGKSSLGYVLMGNPKFQLTGGQIFFKGEKITELPADKRAVSGMFLSFQEPLEVPGLTLSAFIRAALEKKNGTGIRLREYKERLAHAMELLHMDASWADRDLNVGFSGGEKKKAEILQLLMLKPDLAILDETDSGLDVDAVRVVSEGIEAYRKESEGALLIITHSTRILDALQVDYTHVMMDGEIVKTGDRQIIEQINESGYESFNR